MTAAAPSAWIPTNLPPERSTFVGREADLAALARLVGDHERLITLVGPGGSGKTRLAQRLGALLLESAPSPVGSVWFCDLSEARTLGALVAGVSDALDMPLGNGSSAAEASRQIAHALFARQPMLLILDNFEQLVEHAAPTIGSWRMRAPGVTFVVTSRTRLRLEGEVQVDVGPLSATDALALFQDRARRVFPGFDSARHEAPLRELLQRLDHGPLAIELAAARVKVLPPKRLLDRFAARLDLLRSAQRDALPRHVTLRSAIDGSWDLLDPAEQQALAQASVFHGSFTVEAAESVLRMLAPNAEGEPAATVDVLEALVEKSLLFQADAQDAGDVRFRLSETVRDYAAEKLDELGPAMRAQVEARHSEYFLALVERSANAAFAPWGGATERSAMRELDQLLAIARRAAERTPELLARAALALDAMVRQRGRGDELRRALDEASARCETATVRQRASLRIASADAFRLNGRFPEARAEIERALSIAFIDSAESALANVVLAEVEIDAGNLERARAVAEHALGFARAAADPRLEVLALHTLARAHVDADDLGPAQARCDEALPLARALGLPLIESRLHKVLGIIAARTAQLDSAESHYVASATIARELADTYLELAATLNVADVRARRAQYDAALADLRDVIAAAAGAGFRRVEGVALNHLGLIEHDRERFESAREYHAEGVAIHREMGNTRSEAFALESSGLLALEEGRLDDAEAMLERSLELGRAGGLFAVVASSGAYLASLLADRGRVDVVDAALAEALEAARGIGRAEPTGIVTLFEARVWVTLGRAPGAQRSDATRQREAEARKRYEQAATVAAHSARCRIARRLLGRALDLMPISAVPSSAHAAAGKLLVAADGRWFQRADGAAVDLATRRALRLLLLALTKLRIEQPGQALTLEALFAAGWPGEHIAQTAAFRRVYTAIGTLRDFGLRDLLIRRDDGYLLAPSVAIVFPAPGPV